MPKYLVKHTTLLHNKKVYGEGSEIELTEEQAARIPDFVTLVPEKNISIKTGTKTTKVDSKSDATKTESIPKEDGGK